MKKLFLSLLFPALAFAAPVTNTVTVPALVFATTPLTGAERVPLYQSGLKSATVAQINADPVNYTTAISNQTAAVRGSLNAASNSVTSISNAFITVSNAWVTGSNSFTAANASNFQINSNANLNTSNQVAGILQRTNGFYTSDNPAKYQTVTQVSNTVLNAVAAAQFGVTTNGASVNFRNVLTPSVYLGSFAPQSANNFTNIALDLSAGNFQTIDVNPINSSSSFRFVFANPQDGQNVWLLVRSVNNIAYFFAAGGGVDSWNGSGATNGFSVSSSQKTALLNWQVMGTNVIFTSSIHP